MERFTQRDEFGNAIITALADKMPDLYVDLSEAESNALTAALNRLADYEDSGLEPEDLESDKFLLQYLAENNGYMALILFREVMEAQKDGRLVALEAQKGGDG